MWEYYTIMRISKDKQCLRWQIVQYALENGVKPALELSIVLLRRLGNGLIDGKKVAGLVLWIKAKPLGILKDILLRSKRT